MTQNTAASAPTGPLDVALQHTARLLATNPELAIEQATEILKAAPHHALATLMLGIAHRSAGNPLLARKIFEALTSAQPRWAPAFFELGVTLLELSHSEAGLKALRRTVYLKDDMPDAWRMIGDELTALGDAAGADQAYAQHLKASTKDPRLLAAAAALCDNQIAQAEALLRQHLKVFPTDIAALRMLAEVAGRLGRNPDAQVLLERCLELSPSFTAARHNYALVLQRQNKLVEALAQVEQLTQAEPRNAGYRNLRAVVLAKIGEYGTAMDLYADILAKHPEQAKIWMSYGHVLATAGRTDDSIAAYRKTIHLQPTLGEAHYSLANLKTFRFTDAELTQMQSLVKDPRSTAEDRALFHFAIGKALEDLRQYAASFEHYASGNALRLDRVGYDPALTTALVQRSKELLTEEFFASRRDFGSPAPDPIFVVGLPRAGSTLIEQILASHSQVEGTSELSDVMAMAAALSGPAKAKEPAYPGVLATLSEADCRALGEQYLERTRIQRKTDKPFFIDKLPNNFLHIGLIRLMLPNAKIIDARRHPMACCFSGFKQNFAEGQRYTYSMEHIGRYYRDYVEWMAHVDGVLSGKVHRVIYERMVEDTETEVRRLLAYCGLEFEATCLRFYENERGVRTASSQQVRKPINRDGLEQWRHFEPWLGPLSSTLGDVLARYPDTPEY